MQEEISTEDMILRCFNPKYQPKKERESKKMNESKEDTIETLNSRLAYYQSECAYYRGKCEVYEKLLGAPEELKNE